MSRRAARSVWSVVLLGVVHLVCAPCAGMAATVAASHCEDVGHAAGILGVACDHGDSPRWCATPPVSEGVLERAPVAAPLDFTLARSAATASPCVTSRLVSRPPALALHGASVPLRC